MSECSARLALPRFSRFSWLMGLYGENFQRLTRMFQPQTLAVGSFDARIGNGLDLVVDVLQQHAYTSELRLSYRIADPVTGQPDPSAYVRCYRDARQAEVTHCYVGRAWQDVLGLRPDLKVMIGHRLRMNSFLSKWLEYLEGQGYGAANLHPLETAAPEKENAACA